MIHFTEEQCSVAKKLEDDDFVTWVADHLKVHFPVINEPDELFRGRLKAALDYSNTLPLREDGARRDFLLLETFYPGFYQKPEVEKWLKTLNGYTPEQRLEDLKHVMINRDRRGL